MTSFIRSFIPPVIFCSGIAAMIMVIAMVNNPPQPVVIADQKEPTIEIPEIIIYAKPNPKPKAKAKAKVAIATPTKAEVGATRRKLHWSHAVRSTKVRSSGYHIADGYHHDPPTDIEFTESVGHNPGKPAQ